MCIWDSRNPVLKRRKHLQLGSNGSFGKECLYRYLFVFASVFVPSTNIDSNSISPISESFWTSCKKALLHIRSCFFKKSCCRGMIRCRFVLQQLHKPDVGFARFFYSSARENSSHVCIYNNRKHILRGDLSPPPAIIGMQFSVIWFFRNLGHFKYRIVLVNHCCNIYRHDCLIFAYFHCTVSSFSVGFWAI